jgi:hypothetical protein
MTAVDLAKRQLAIDCSTERHFRQPPGLAVKSIVADKPCSYFPACERLGCRLITSS